MSDHQVISPDLLSAALDYASKGLPVIPCNEHKRPRTEHGLLDATTDEAQIRDWWTRWPDAMIGMPTGPRSGVWVLDIDDPQAFEANCPITIPETRRCDTGKGYHLYFRFDPSNPIRNTQRTAKQKAAGSWPIPSLPGAETRGDGGYVIVPPSVHPTGRLYRWASSGASALAPTDLCNILVHRAQREPQTTIAPAPSGVDTPYGLKALDDECAAIRSAGNGEQEGSLNEAALKIGALVAGGELSMATAKGRLLSAGLAMPSYNSRDQWTTDMVVAKVERGMSDGAAHPRSAPKRDNLHRLTQPVLEASAPEDYGFVDKDGVWTAYGPDWQAPTDEPSAPNLLPVVNFAEWLGNPPIRRSAWGDLLPLHTTTMLTGPGGVGKSLFEQMLMTCIALGLPFLGQTTKQMNTLYVTCEDDTAEIWRRQCAINAMLGVGMTDLQGKLHLVSLAGEAETALATFNEAGQVRPTVRWRSIEATCETLNIRAFAFDNATDAMAGDLNDLHQVAEFVSMMTGLAIKRDGIAMILHHPNKAGDEWLGSVAWHNKVRSRLIIERPDEHDPDLRCVKNPKANYGPSGGEIRFRWHEGAFVRDEDIADDTAQKLRELSIANGQNSVFLACLREREKQGVERMVGPATGPNYAPSQFEGMPQAKGFKRKALKAAMDRLFDMGVIETKQVPRPGKSETKTVIVETSPNAR